ncbi:hypothetical protein [Paenibacillus thiaminolyticus]|uniref:Uncharacterized protein n=1 Tax=Paenibacillus thiaminolyticus TaxID=49283 RepID=A0A3A3GGF2_PANTH|nr:hypothetical protein [Paenibacillus thiaminolyticus]RJG23294.1 hypothetical protein DQX05_13675 [Paenibacillus thiaminolyticus]RJG23311.1 hypothetical protein DQX05_13765 [Paenibacillus thiaminolyticus]
MRKQMQVYSSVKNIVQDLKSELELKNESEVIAYLYCIYKQRYKSITLDEHKKATAEMKNIINQSTL